MQSMQQMAPGGKQLFYMNGNRLMSVDLNADSGLYPTKPRRLVERTFSPSSADSGAWGHTYAVFPDGKAVPVRRQCRLAGGP